MRIYAASDHAGVALRGKLVARLRSQGHAVTDFGPDTDAPQDYPDWAARVGRAVRGDPGTVGLLLCGSGIGISIAANKVRGIRAVAPWHVESARLSRSHNDANVLCLGVRLLPEPEIDAIVDTWLTTAFEGDGGGRHQRRVAKIWALETEEVGIATVEWERARLEARQVVPGIWAADPRAFTRDPAHDSSVRNRLGWLRVPEEMSARVAELEAFAARARDDGFRRVVVLGMGGSSLFPEVLARTFAGASAGGMQLSILDSTDPQAVAEVEHSGDLQRTLFLVSSKSGGTVEVSSFERYFRERTGNGQGNAGQFVAITDPGTELDRRATADGYRAVFRNPADIGGRYSALSYFGLVPAALLGVDLSRLLARGRNMASACREPAVARNPGADLGALLGTMARAGRDKLTLLLSPAIESFGSWIEQLVAESTGKLGKGIIPVEGEPLAAPALYGPDRVFVSISVRSAAAPGATPEALQALRAAGHPVVEIDLADSYDLGGELFRWEMATAVAGAVLDLNPFDEPNVTEAKEATRALLEAYARDRTLPEADAVSPDDAAAILTHIDSGMVGRGDYLAVCAFFHRTEARHALLARLRDTLRARRRLATTVGYGPRYLHSTGQLHKGGPPSGVFIQLTTRAAPGADLPIPGQSFTFGVLRDAQALGDLQVLRKHGRRALRIDLGDDVEGGLARVLAVVAAPVNRPGSSVS